MHILWQILVSFSCRIEKLFSNPSYLKKSSWRSHIPPQHNWSSIMFNHHRCILSSPYICLSIHAKLDFKMLCFFRCLLSKFFSIYFIMRLLACFVSMVIPITVLTDSLLIIALRNLSWISETRNYQIFLVISVSFIN